MLNSNVLRFGTRRREAKVFSFDIGQFPYTVGNAKLMKADSTIHSFLLHHKLNKSQEDMKEEPTSSQT